MGPATAAGIPLIGTDNGAAAPLDADNGSIAAVAAQVLPSTVQIQASGGADGDRAGGATGSGFVLDDTGHVITNNHVVADAPAPDSSRSSTSDGTASTRRPIVGRSPVYDIAVLEVDGASSAAPGRDRLLEADAGRRHRGRDRVAARAEQHGHLRHRQRDSTGR